MINIIIIDTNIYRQLGTGFYNNIDYKNLVNYCYASGSEIRISEVVFNEYMSYYNSEIIDKSLKNLEQTIDKLKDIPEVQISKKLLPTSESIDKARVFISDKFKENALLLNNIYVPVGILSDFLVKNKQATKKDNTRDFLIWLTAIREAQLHEDDQIILISNDKIFKENQYFQNLLADLKLESKIVVQNSIPELLNKYGEQYDFLTSELILGKISKTKIENEIKKDINSFPSYISSLFYHTRKKFEIDKFEIGNISVDSFYSFKEMDTGKTKFLSHIKVELDIIYGAEKPEIIENHLKSLPSYRRELETFDESNRPIFNKEILFIFEGELNIERKSISRIKYLDFIIDYYFDIYKMAAPNNV